MVEGSDHGDGKEEKYLNVLKIENKKIYKPIQIDPTALMTLRSVPSASLLILSKRTNGAIPFPSHIWF